MPFDERGGVIPNECGRVLGQDGRPLPGVYCAGWIKRGPSGVIGTNKKDATETVRLLLEDAEEGCIGTSPREGRLEVLLEERGVGPVTYAGWEAIDAGERERGTPLGRPRVKFTTWDDLIEAARAGVAGRSS